MIHMLHIVRGRDLDGSNFFFLGSEHGCDGVEGSCEHRRSLGGWNFTRLKVTNYTPINVETSDKLRILEYKYSY